MRMLSEVVTTLIVDVVMVTPNLVKQYPIALPCLISKTYLGP